MKKRYVLKLNGDQHGAVVARGARGTSVAIDEHDALPVDERGVLAGKAISLRVGGRVHLVHLTRADAKGNLQATIHGRPVTLTVMDELRAQALESLGEAAGSGTLAADIPGLVVEVKVKPGQLVHQGEPLIVVEAMKMQNELAAGVTGVVASIPVGVGQSVNPGDVLVVVEPQPGG